MQIPLRSPRRAGRVAPATAAGLAALMHEGAGHAPISTTWSKTSAPCAVLAAAGHLSKQKYGARTLPVQARSNEATVAPAPDRDVRSTRKPCVREQRGHRLGLRRADLDRRRSARRDQPRQLRHDARDNRRDRRGRRTAPPPVRIAHIGRQRLVRRRYRAGWTASGRIAADRRRPVALDELGAPGQPSRSALRRAYSSAAADASTPSRRASGHWSSAASSNVPGPVPRSRIVAGARSPKCATAASISVSLSGARNQHAGADREVDRPEAARCR